MNAAHQFYQYHAVQFNFPAISSNELAFYRLKCTCTKVSTKVSIKRPQDGGGDDGDDNKDDNDDQCKDKCQYV